MTNSNGETNILIVDDEPTIRRLLNRRLTMEGYCCDEADCAEMALEKLEQKPAELVILDISMPGKSGLDLLPEITAFYSDTAVIMATALTQTDIIISCMKEGAHDYITKPFDLDEVVLAIRRSLTKRNLAMKIKEYKNTLELKVMEQDRKIRKLSLGAIESLVYALEAKDKYTAGHSRRVNDISLGIGRAYGLSQDEIEDLHWGALLHDVGKIAVDPAVQNKPGKLTDAEYRHVMIHACIGPGIVQPVANENVVEIIRHHHDRWDGMGLDQTIEGENIPLGARIIAIADTFDAMTSNRPYREAKSNEEAFAEIKRCAGSQFDPEVVEAFFRVPLAELKRAQLMREVANTASLFGSA